MSRDERAACSRQLLRATCKRVPAHEGAAVLKPGQAHLPLSRLLEWTLLIALVETMGILLDALGLKAGAHSVLYELYELVVRGLLDLASLLGVLALSTFGITLMCTHFGHVRSPASETNQHHRRMRSWWPW